MSAAIHRGRGRKYFGARIMDAMFGAVGLASTRGMAIGPVLGGRVYDAFGSYFWLFVASCALGIGAVAIASAFRAPARGPAPLRPQPGIAAG